MEPTQHQCLMRKYPGKFPRVLSRNTLTVTNLHSTVTTRTPKKRSLHNHKPAIAGHLDGEGAAWVCAGFLVAREGGNAGVGAGLEGATAHATGPPLRHIAVQRVIPCRKVQSDGARFGRGIDAHGVPGVTGAAGKDHVLARIAVDEADFIPLRRDLLHEVHGPLRGVREVVRSHGEVLDGALEEDGRRQGEDVRGAADGARERGVVRRVIDLVQRTAAEVHRRHSIPDERVQAGVKGLRIVPDLREMQVFARQDRLGRGEVRVHPFPAPGQRAAMEDHHQAEVVGIGQDILVELHRLLLVRAEEVHLDAPDTDALHPLHLPPAGNAPVHDVPRPLRRIVPVAVGVVPEAELDALGPGIGRQFPDPFPADPGVPPVVYEHRLPAHRRAEIDILLLGVEVDAVVHLDDPTPGALGAAVGLGRRILRFHDIPCHGRLRDGFQVRADGDGPPRRISGHRNSGRHRPVAVELLLHRKAQPVGSVGKADEPSTAVVPMDTGLGHRSRSAGSIPCPRCGTDPETHSHTRPRSCPGSHRPCRRSRNSVSSGRIPPSAASAGTGRRSFPRGTHILSPPPAPGIPS